MKPIPLFVVSFLGALSAPAQSADTLSDTAPLTWPEADLSARVMDGAHAFVDRKIAESVANRARYWSRDYSSPEAYHRSVDANRERLRTILGVVDPRLAPQMERFGDDANPALVAETPRFRVFQVRWPVLEGFFGIGLLIQPKSPAIGHIVLVPDAGQPPEQLVALAPASSLTTSAGPAPARQFAENGFEIIIPVTISREKLPATDPAMRSSDQTYREWIYRQAFHLGRHVIGYEVQTVLAAVDWFKRRDSGGKVGVAGYGEGGLVAFHAAAIDPRIDAALVSGYFHSREQVWSEPIYRNVWSRLREFGDAEIASLILPRGLVIEHSAGPTVSGQKGELQPATWDDVKAEASRAETLARLAPPHLVHGRAGAVIGPYSSDALVAFAQRLGATALEPAASESALDRRTAFDSAARHARVFHEMEAHVQTLLRRADEVRERAFLLKVMPEFAGGGWTTDRRLPTHSPQKFIAAANDYRRQFAEEAMGRFDEPLLPFHPRTRKVAESTKWIAYDVVLDVYPELIAWGVLVVPRDLKPGERRPVVVCQHGRNGLPRDTLDGNKTAYNNFAGVLAERGFITFAPHNLYRGEDRYRWLTRKANTIKATLFSFILAQHDQILRWLDTLPFVDGSRIAFYGLSYGGETAVRVPAVLEKYCLSICSGDFNQWTRKVAATDLPFSFMRTIEWEMPYWNLGNTFDYAEMTYLIFPRPFMVERGHLDRVGRDPWVAHEYAKVRWLYAQFGLPDRTAIEYFQGGHSINGEGTFTFLSQHLNWPPR